MLWAWYAKGTLGFLRGFYNPQVGLGVFSEPKEHPSHAALGVRGLFNPWRCLAPANTVQHGWDKHLSILFVWKRLTGWPEES